MFKGIQRIDLSHQLKTSPGMSKCSIWVSSSLTLIPVPLPCWNRGWWKIPLFLVTTGLQVPFLWTKSLVWNPSMLKKLLHCWGTGLGCFQFKNVFLKRQQSNLKLGLPVLFCFLSRLFIFALSWKCVCSVTQSCPSLCTPLGCSPPVSSVHGISQARILKWIAISSSRGSSWPRDWTWVSCVSCIGRRILHHWAIWEAQVFPKPLRN